MLFLRRSRFRFRSRSSLILLQRTQLKLILLHNRRKPSTLRNIRILAARLRRLRRLRRHAAWQACIATAGSHAAASLTAARSVDARGFGALVVLAGGFAMDLSNPGAGRVPGGCAAWWEAAAGNIVAVLSTGFARVVDDYDDDCDADQYG
jgi:hypothetical protein